jgi:hypothetical protein
MAREHDWTPTLKAMNGENKSNKIETAALKILMFLSAALIGWVLIGGPR